MKPSLILAVLVVATGCGSSTNDTTVCDQLATAETDFTAKASPCFSTVPTLGFTADVCRASISKCASGDLQKITTFTTCLEQLPTCSPAAIQSWSASLQACEDGLVPLGSGGC